MIIARGRLSFPKYEKAKFSAAMRKTIEVAMRQAAREWLRAVIIKVPVFTGTARGSLMPLGRLLNVAVPVNPKVSRPNLGPDVGAAMAPKAMTSYFPAPRGGTLYTFEFRTDVAHFVANNLNPAHDPPFHLIEKTPWYATEAGNLAFNEYMRTELPKRLKKLRLRDFISFQSISYGGG